MPYIRVPKLSGSHPQVLETAVQVKLRWTLNNVPCVNVLGGRVAGGWANSQTHADDLTTAIGAAYTSSGLKALHASTTILNGAGIRDLRTANQVEYESLGLGLAGTGGGDGLPNSLAAVMTLRTALAGKSFRGRMYISGANEAQNDANGRIDGSYNTTCIIFMEAVQTAMAAEGITLAVLSFKRYANLPPPADIETWGGAVTDVTAIKARDTQWDIQRRRAD